MNDYIDGIVSIANEYCYSMNSHTSSGLCGGGLLHERLDIVGGEESRLSIELPSPPVTVLTEHCHHAAFGKAQLIF